MASIATLATLHVHLDDDSCMEVTALRGASSEVQHFADHIIAERGVRYGRVVMIPTDEAKLRRMPANKRARGHQSRLTCGYRAATGGLNSALTFYLHIAPIRDRS